MFIKAQKKNELCFMILLKKHVTLVSYYIQDLFVLFAMQSYVNLCKFYLVYIIVSLGLIIKLRKE